MPLNGSDQASKPAGTSAVPNTTIESDKYNSVVNDIYQILNTVRTVAKGFTGASTAIGAQDNLNTVSSDIASASAVDLSDATGVVVNITGTTTIASLGTVGAGGYRVLIFGDALTLTHGTSLKLPGDEDLTVAAGDVAIFRSEGSGTWHLESFLPKEGYLKPSDVGTTAGTVAAGDDSRITGAVQKADTSTSDFDFVVDEDDMSSDSATKVPTQQSVKAYADALGGRAKASVNFDGTDGSINGSYNVASVTRNGTGDYTIAFENALPDANYALAGMGMPGLSTNVTGGSIVTLHPTSGAPTLKSTSAVRILTGNSSSGAPFDVKNISVVVF